MTTNQPLIAIYSKQLPQWFIDAFVNHTFPEANGLNTIEVCSPNNGDIIARIQGETPAQISANFDNAQHAQRRWQQVSLTERKNALTHWYNILMAHRDGLAQIIRIETGKPWSEALSEVDYGLSYLEWYAHQALRIAGSYKANFVVGKAIQTVQKPVGVCAAITPWNFPFAMIARKVAPAIAAGCAMVVKPAPATPLTALAMQLLAAQVQWPPSLFQVCIADDANAFSDIACAHPQVKKLTFTGSTAVGKLLMAKAANRIVNVSFELGGNAPFIVLPDANLDLAIRGLLTAKFRNAGQACIAANRVLVSNAIIKPFTEKLLDAVRQLRFDGESAQGDIGPLINQAAVNRVAQMVNDAKQQGAHELLRIPHQQMQGSYHDIVVLTNVSPQMAIVNSEIFGPVLTLQTFLGSEDAISMANDTPYGLAAYVFGHHDLPAIAQQIQSGMVGVNEGAISLAAAPFGGINQSGIGREGGEQGIEAFLETQYWCVSE